MANDQWSDHEAGFGGILLHFGFYSGQGKVETGRPLCALYSGELRWSLEQGAIMTRIGGGFHLNSRSVSIMDSSSQPLSLPPTGCASLWQPQMLRMSSATTATLGQGSLPEESSLP